MNTKAQIHRILLTAIALLAPGSALSADQANTNRCVIYVTSDFPCHGAMLAGPDAAKYYTVNAWFVDSEPLANLNAGRCMERAKEYKAWCSDGILRNAKTAHAYFQTNNGTMNVIASIENTDNKTYLGDGVARMLRWHD